MIELSAADRNDDTAIDGTVRWFLDLQKSYKKKGFDKWEKSGRKIVKEYRGERDLVEYLPIPGSGNTYNLLWSNVQTLKPALYSRTPKSVIERRYKDADPIGRVTAQILERATQFQISNQDFDGVMDPVVEDYLLPGRGVARVLYKFKKGVIQEPGPDGMPISREVLTEEEVVIKYVNWEDFGHTPARNWSEVETVWFREFLTKAEVTERFGKEIADKLQYENKARERISDDEPYDPSAKAEICEVWHKPQKKVYFIAPCYGQGPIEIKDDFLKLKGFFPIPKPLFATTTTDSLVPVPDFKIYQKLAFEINELSDRISNLTATMVAKAVCPAEVYETLQNFFTTAEATVFPIKDWQALKELGGLKGALEFHDLTDIANTITKLIEQKNERLNSSYQITGMADIVRGFSSPSETATAQQIKGQFATLRISDRQRAVQKFAKELIALTAEIIAEHFQPETIARMIGLTDMDPDTQAKFSQAIMLMRDDPMRNFKIDIETDSTIAIDDNFAKQSANEFMTAFGQYFSQAFQFAQMDPNIVPVVMEGAQFVLRQYRTGRPLEASIEKYIQDFVAQQEAAKQQPPPPPPPDPAMIKAEAEAQYKQQMVQLESQIAQSTQQIELMKAQFDQQLKAEKLNADMMLKQQKLEMTSQLEALKFQNQMMVESYNRQQPAEAQVKEPSAQPLSVVVNMPPQTTKQVGAIRTGPDGTRMFEVQQVPQ